MAITAASTNSSPHGLALGPTPARRQPHPDFPLAVVALAVRWIAKQVSPMTYVGSDIPLIVVQGANDNTAPIADSRKLVANLKTAGADVTMHEVSGAGHGFASPATAWPDAEKAMFDWLTSKGIGR